MTCRKGREFLAQATAGAEERDFFLQPLSRAELVELVGDRPVADIFSFKSPTAKAQGITPGSRSDDELIDLICAEPRLMRRPLLKHADRLLVGFNAKEWEQALA